jgi:hypothetical protein
LAIYNEILVGRFNRALQKYFGIKGGPPAPQLASDIQVAHNLESGQENRYLEGWFLYGIGKQFAAGGAGNTNQLRLRNPVTSGSVAVITKINLANSSVAADAPVIDVGGGTGAAVTTDLATSEAANVVSMDRRMNKLSGMSLSSVQNAAPVVQGVIVAALMPANGNFEVLFDDSQELPLLPGMALQIRGSAGNITSSVTLWWRERSLEEGETF